MDNDSDSDGDVDSGASDLEDEHWTIYCDVDSVWIANSSKFR